MDIEIKLIGVGVTQLRPDWIIPAAIYRVF